MRWEHSTRRMGFFGQRPKHWKRLDLHSFAKECSDLALGPFRELAVGHFVTWMQGMTASEHDVLLMTRFDVRALHAQAFHGMLCRPCCADPAKPLRNRLGSASSCSSSLHGMCTSTRSSEHSSIQHHLPEPAGFPLDRGYKILPKLRVPDAGSSYRTELPCMCYLGGVNIKGLW